MIKNLAFFPMTSDMCAIVRNQSMLQHYVLSQLLVPSFARLANEDISKIDGGSATNVKLAEYCSNALEGCDVLFVDYDENMQSISVYNEVIQDAGRMGKDIILSRKLEMRLRDVTETQFVDLQLPKNPENDYLYEIKVPVITVITQGPRADQFAIELALRKHFISEGYKVTQIGSYAAAIFFGFSELPGFMYEPGDGYEKAIRFNRYVKELIDNEKPDLLILGIPEATMKYNDKLLNGLGILPFIACSSVRSDLQILSMYRNSYKKNYFDEMCNHGVYRLGAPIRFFNISNTSVVPDISSDNGKYKYIDLSSRFVLDNIQDDVKYGQYHIFNVLDNESAKGAFIAAQELLIGNASSM